MPFHLETGRILGRLFFPKRLVGCRMRIVLSADPPPPPEGAKVPKLRRVFGGHLFPCVAAPYFRSPGGVSPVAILPTDRLKCTRTKRVTSKDVTRSRSFQLRPDTRGVRGRKKKGSGGHGKGRKEQLDRRKGTHR